ncbi:zf-HC2 domain-containing protein [Nonomuraea sp. MCN248]|uniref:Zf-HC2 domain-containing protein n=1 Tax=Nonomuraea corallina TaxID=2989783 RepID=A0ABT4S5B4_9ACTN|nr:zf-HC2 domain-containing protein [Nonomuraea corallina]MDA0632393.1 zf-HC2 domain-containing protein [Nonomuraea corallina]
MSTAWHMDDELAADYARGRTGPTLAASVEAHLLACAACRGKLAPEVPRARLDRVWDEITAAVDAPRPTSFERLLRVLGVPEHTARLLAVTSSLKPAWIAAGAVALLFAALASGETSRFGTLVFLAVAPILPVAGVVLAYGRGADPAHEIAFAAPYSVVRLTLLRAAAVLGVCVALALVIGLAVLGDGGLMAVWLLPALALTTLTLALAGWLDPLMSGGAVAALWFAGFAAVAVYEVRPVLFGSVGQLASLAVFAVSAFVIFIRRREFS